MAKPHKVNSISGNYKYQCYLINLRERDRERLCVCERERNRERLCNKN